MLDGKKIRRRATAPPRRKFTSTGVDQMLEQAAATLEKNYPGRAFRLAPLAGGRFNLIEVPCPQMESAGEELHA